MTILTLTPLDFLFLVLAICVFILTIFISMLLANITAMVKDSRRIVVKAEDIVDQVNTYFVIPSQILGQIQSFIGRFKGRSENDQE